MEFFARTHDIPGKKRVSQVSHPLYRSDEFLFLKSLLPCDLVIFISLLHIITGIEQECM